jgi:hypothetical protein
MTPPEFEMVMLAQTSYRLAMSDSLDELICIALTIRNWVVPRPGSLIPCKSYPVACREFLASYPVRDLPYGDEDVLTAPGALLSLIDSIYNCSHPDITATQTTPGALYFGRASSLLPGDWRYQISRTRQLLGTFGTQQFWA